ncbi:MAG TPA: GNAT family N-acetyltransferase [Marmoricola sp.]|nr:GNAT family N-acetyltransferase [Marmoricola sp.]
MTKSGLRSSLGPHVVGTRVVVRRVVPGETGPTGGPAMTDVLGICESWADGIVVVRREDGTTVEIATADIVSGKPVPPRPSTRLRISPRDAESHAAQHWPGVVREPLGEWELRTEPTPEGRMRKRANSCLAMGDPGMPLDEAATAVVGFYRSRNRTPMVQVEVGSDADTWFTGAGWTPVAGGDSLFLLGSSSRARRLLGPIARDEVALAADGPRVHASIPDRAWAKASLDGDWLGVHDVRVEPEHRRQGLARAVVAALLGWGSERGATTVWLHVETGNDAAIALYEGMGLQVHHACRYLGAPGSL